MFSGNQSIVYIDIFDNPTYVVTKDFNLFLDHIKNTCYTCSAAFYTNVQIYTVYG